MKITVSGERKDVKDGLTIAELIVQENVETPQYVTVSVNEEFVDQGDFETRELSEGALPPLREFRYCSANSTLLPLRSFLRM